MQLSATERLLLDTILAINQREAQERLGVFVAAVAQDRGIPAEQVRIDGQSGEITDLRAVAEADAATSSGPG